MTQEKVDMFIASKSNYLPQESLPLLREKLLELDESKYVLLQSVDFKDPTIMLIVSLLVGNLGIDRFMLEDIGMGVLKLLTGGVFGILTIIDWCTIMNKTKQHNLNKLMAIL